LETTEETIGLVLFLVLLFVVAAGALDSTPSTIRFGKAQHTLLAETSNMLRSSFAALPILVAALCLESSLAFSTSATAASAAFASPSSSPVAGRGAVSLAAATQTTQSSSSSLLPNPFKKLPWNVKKEQERQARRMKQDRAKLHRQLGIAEDATYEEIVAATDQLIAAAGSDMKQKVQIEVAKDKILQHRLNERLAGLQAESKEARAMSNYEVEG